MKKRTEKLLHHPKEPHPQATEMLPAGKGIVRFLLLPPGQKEGVWRDATRRL